MLLKATMKVFFCLFLAALVTSDAFVLQRFAAPRRSSCLEALKRGDARGAALVVEDASVYRGPAHILSSIDWRVEPKAKWAIVGANGCGKSTLLKALVGDVDCDGGDIIISTTQQVGYLQQTAVAGSNKTIFEEAASAMKEIQDARASLEQAQAAVEQDPSEQNLKKLDAATQNFESVGGYTQEQTVSSVLKGLGFDDMDQRCDELSGGWQMRVALARLLLSQPTLLLLGTLSPHQSYYLFHDTLSRPESHHSRFTHKDEPSNHLDVNARKWLANYLKNYLAGAMILVTHDVALLESVSHIAEISGGTLEAYKSCTYSQYLQEKQRRADAAVSEYERNQQKAAKLQGFVDRFGASATKASAAQSRVKQLEKMKQQGLLDAPTHSSRFRPLLVLPDPPHAVGESLLKLKGASVGWTESPLVSNIDLNIQKGMKILLRGPNGAGKSTILAALRGNLDLLEGTRTENSQLRYVPTLASVHAHDYYACIPCLTFFTSLGVFTQDLAQELDENARAVDLVLQHAREGDVSITEQDARSIMGRLGLSDDKPLRLVGDLSGGEKARVALSMFGLKPNNLLILDEPSNHLDVECSKALSQALSDWEGPVVVVSHDKAFCETIGFTHVGTVENGGFRLEERSLRASDWSQFECEEGVNGATSESKTQPVLNRKLQKQAYNAPKRIEKLEQLMEELEVKVAAVEEEMLTYGSNVDKLLELTHEKEQLDAQIEAYMTEWEELEEVLLSVES